jgi:hypothetical protein
MSRFKIYLLSVAGLVIIVMTGAPVISRHAIAESPKPVTIVSPLPVPITDVDVSNAARHAFQAQTTFTIGATFSEVCSAIATVPAGQRLAIEYAGATVGPMAAGESVRHVQLRTKLDSGASVFHNLVTNPPNLFNEVLVGQLVRIYGDPTATVDMCVARGTSTADAVSVIGTVSGFLVDLP